MGSGLRFNPGENTFLHMSRHGIRIDAHTHCYPECIWSNGADPVAWGRAHGEPLWANMVAAHGKKASLQGFVSPEQMCRDMDEAEISHALLLGWYWESPQTCRWHNRAMAQWIERNPGRFSAFAALQIRGNSRVKEDLEDALSLGFKGIGEVFPKAQGFSMRDPAWFAALEWAQDHHWPVNLHVEEPVGRPHAGRAYPLLDDYQFIAKRFDKVCFIFAHWGGGLPFYELNPAVKADLSNVLYDTAASPFLYDNAVFPHVLDIVGSERILFGTDYPLRLYPQKNSPPKMAPFAEIASSKMTAPQAALVMGENAKNLLGL